MLRVLLLFLFVLNYSLFVHTQFEDDQFDLDEGWFTEEMYNDPYFVKLREQKYGFIVPGTKWCGRGDKAKTKEDLGRFNRTDICCRAHDLCPVVIEAGKSLHGLNNTDGSSRLSCECDEAFYNCLKQNQDLLSKTIGTIYFDILNKKCLANIDGKWVWRENKVYSNRTFIKKLKTHLGLN
ncbi:phospholipase A2-like [Chelonus insularis]|uniref:phospholipase A2-like n=1 Tax=Chelonus insularis TaxID=460826 RepID=UPI00158DE623|nr:phospholipase A2-like [Chelonus insularis]